MVLDLDTVAIVTDEAKHCVAELLFEASDEHVVAPDDLGRQADVEDVSAGAAAALCLDPCAVEIGQDLVEQPCDHHPLLPLLHKEQQ